MSTEENTPEPAAAPEPNKWNEEHPLHGPFPTD